MTWITLMDAVTGTFVVTTQLSVYVFDLDLRAVVRLEHTDPITPETMMRRNRELIDLVEISECTVGRPLVLLTDPHIPDALECRRSSSPVVRIQELKVLP
jgi:hypothetical protein